MITAAIKTMVNFKRIKDAKLAFKIPFGLTFPPVIQIFRIPIVRKQIFKVVKQYPRSNLKSPGSTQCFTSCRFLVDNKLGSCTLFLCFNNLPVQCNYIRNNLLHFSCFQRKNLARISPVQQSSASAAASTTGPRMINGPACRASESQLDGVEGGGMGSEQQG